MLVIWGGFEHALGDWRAYSVCNGLNASVRWGGDAAGPLNLRLLGSSLVGRRRSGNTSAPMGMMGRARSWQLHTLRVAGCVRTQARRVATSPIHNYEVATFFVAVGDCCRGEREEFHRKPIAGCAGGAGRAREVQRVP